LEDQVEQALLGGATIIQLREKDLSTGDFLDIAGRIKQVTDKYNIPLIINDRLDIALAVDAAGLHVGQSDMPALMARRLLGREKILGVSVSNVEEAVKAQRDGADYVAVGAVFPTGTKTDAQLVEYAEIKRVCDSVTVPVIAIGGINQGNALQLKGTGLKGIALVSAIFAQRDIKAAAETMKELAAAIAGRR
jgi:thiamine-phosphate pyrophosphorylase